MTSTEGTGTAGDDVTGSVGCGGDDVTGFAGSAGSSVSPAGMAQERKRDHHQLETPTNLPHSTDQNTNSINLQKHTWGVPG